MKATMELRARCGARHRAKGHQAARGAGVAALTALLLLLAAPASVAAEPPAERQVGQAGARDHSAAGLRFGLLGFVGIALAGGAYAQYQSLATLRRGGVSAPPPHRPPVAGGPPRGATQAAPSPGAPHRVAPPAGPRRSSAEEHCARAIAAAHRYDRHTTRAAFSSAIVCDPEVKPSLLPGFWDLPSGGHADLARAYLERGQHLDARSVLTFAIMLFPHNRELEALAREADWPTRPPRSA